MSIQFKGFDELQRELKQLEQRAKELDGTHEVSFSELFTPHFMRTYTRHQSFDDLLDAGGFDVKTTEDFEAIPDDVFDAHIAAYTNFSCWEDMLGKATEIYVNAKLGF